MLDLTSGKCFIHIVITVLNNQKHLNRHLLAQNQQRKQLNNL